MSEEILKKLDAKLEQIHNDITEIKINQAVHNETLKHNDENLKEHMHRSNLLEESQEILYEQVSQIKIHIGHVNGFFKGLGILSGFITFILGVLKLLGKI